MAEQSHDTPGKGIVNEKIWCRQHPGRLKVVERERPTASHDQEGIGFVATVHFRTVEYEFGHSP